MMSIEMRESFDTRCGLDSSMPGWLVASTTYRSDGEYEVFEYAGDRRRCRCRILGRALWGIASQSNSWRSTYRERDDGCGARSTTRDPTDDRG